tara:strand:- start:7658 stop:7918 length:261 start_codon:yes stop_codon:yes gene_type:complete
MPPYYNITVGPTNAPEVLGEVERVVMDTMKEGGIKVRPTEIPGWAWVDRKMHPPLNNRVFAETFSGKINPSPIDLGLKYYESMPNP